MVQGGVARLGPGGGRWQRPGSRGVSWSSWRVDRVGGDGPEMRKSATVRVMTGYLVVTVSAWRVKLVELSSILA